MLFLDIEMPEINGLELAEKVHANGYECEIVFLQLIVNMQLMPLS